MDKIIAERFRELRKSIEKNNSKLDHISLRNLAKQLNVSYSTIYSIEEGRKSPDEKVLRAYHKRFNVSYEYLLGESDNPTPENVQIGKELKLSDRAINNLRKLQNNSKALKTLDYILGSDSSERFLTTMFYYWNIKVFNVLDIEDFMSDTDISAKVRINSDETLIANNDVSPKYAYAIKSNLEQRIYQFLINNGFSEEDELLEINLTKE